MSGGPPQRLGNYKLERRIGKGGSSEVYLARHRLLNDRVVAIKLLLSQDEEWIERFTREANLTSKLRHQHIIQIYDHGEQPPYHYTVMEYVNGGSLRDLIENGRRLSLDLALHIFRAAGRALDFAHINGVIHRDVSPGNILLERETTRVLLTDFGIARESGNNGLTTMNRVMGTQGYMSPEHFSSAKHVTHMSDIFSLGVVLYQMLCGRLPWDHTPRLPNEGGGWFTAPRPIKDCGVEGLPADVDRVFQTMLAIDQLKRYPSAQAAIDELEAILNRHTAETRIYRGASGSQPNLRPVAGGAQPATHRAAPSASTAFQVISLPHVVETALGPDLLKGPLEEARRREEQLRDGTEVARLLDTWSSGGRLRLPSLGRRAALHQIRHEKICTYELNVLYETREPEQLVEEPIAKVGTPPIEKSADRWGLDLPVPQNFTEQAGEKVRLPGSVQAVICDRCTGLGRMTCKRCGGKMLVPSITPATASTVSPSAPPRSATSTAGGPSGAATEQRPPAPARMVPCSECGGKGATVCGRCSGQGNLLRHKTVTWRRSPAMFKAHDDLRLTADRQEQQLLKQCAQQQIYQESCVGGTRPEWEQVPELKGLLDSARTRTDGDTKIVLSQVTISFIPRTEVSFDLGGRPRNVRGENGTPIAVTPSYETSIFGFENVLLNDWHFLNWDRVLLVLVSIVGFVFLLLLLFALSALYR
jgi:eukaryotic-like serine/threonine-protein kinase